MVPMWQYVAGISSSASNSSSIQFFFSKRPLRRNSTAEIVPTKAGSSSDANELKMFFVSFHIIYVLHNQFTRYNTAKGSH